MMRSLRDLVIIACLALGGIFPSGLLAANENAMATQEWHMRPGESLSDLARLFYPKNVAMQEKFVAATLDINRGTLETRRPDQPFSKAATIRIPDLRTLANGGTAPADGKVGEMQAQDKPSSAEELDRQQRFEALNARLRSLSGKTAEEMPSVQEADAQPATGNRRIMASGWSLPALGPLPIALIGGGLLFITLAGWAAYRRSHKSTGRVRRDTSNAKAIPVMPEPVMDHVAPVMDAEAGMVKKPSSMQVPDAISASEMASVVDEARVIATIGRIGSAIKLLTDYIDTHPGISAKAWLLLLELYRELGNRPAFDKTAKRMHENFNIMVPTWESAKQNSLLPTSLEEFPHVMGKVVDGWGTQGCRDYLSRLIQDNRDGERIGFGTEVFQEILLLIDMLDQMQKH